VALGRPRNSVCCTAVDVSCRPAVWRRSWRLAAHRVIVVMTRGSRKACRPIGVGAFSSAPPHCARAAAVLSPTVRAPFLPVAFFLFRHCVPYIVYCGVYGLEMLIPETDVLKPVDSSITDSDDWEIFILHDARVVYESNGKLASLLSAYADTPLRVEGRLEAPGRTQTKYCTSTHMALSQLLTFYSNQETI
jgi:hypothetical protein